MNKHDFQLTNINDDIRKMEKARREMFEKLEVDNSEKHKCQQELLQSVKNIEANTVGLNEIIPILSKSMENQEEILEFLREALAIGASENAEEAESRLRKTMAKATTLSTDIETIQKLNGFAKTVYEMVMKMYGGQ